MGNILVQGGITDIAVHVALDGGWPVRETSVRPFPSEKAEGEPSQRSRDPSRPVSLNRSQAARPMARRRVPNCRTVVLGEILSSVSAQEHSLVIGDVVPDDSLQFRVGFNLKRIVGIPFTEIIPWHG